LTTRNTAVTRGKEDGNTTSSQGHVSVAKLVSKGSGNIGLVKAVAGSQDLRGCAHTIQEVDDIQETAQVTILSIIAYGDEGNRNLGSDTDSVLDIEVLYIMYQPENIIMIKESHVQPQFRLG
jgi:hypothetical protein